MRLGINSAIDQVERICISVNTCCNYACEYCYFFDDANRVSPKIPLDSKEIELIIERAFEYHEKYNFSKRMKINFVGSGEPLLNWTELSKAVSGFWERHFGQDCIRFYIVTNGSLITPTIAQEMKRLMIIPSVSLDGPKELHDAHRLFPNGKGTFDKTMNGIMLLQNAGLNVTINTTLTRNLLENIDLYIDFIIQQKFTKIIFDRLVDAPKGIDKISDEENYTFLSATAELLKQHNLEHLEIGNIEAYQRSISGIPDQVCTMFGSSCGAGTHFLIYANREVYPCGRMLGKTQWLLGNYKEEIDELQKRMYKKMPYKSDCLSCNVSKECIRDCILERNCDNYNCQSRQKFLCSFQNR